MRHLFLRGIGLLVLLTSLIMASLADADDTLLPAEGDQSTLDEATLIEAILEHNTACREEVVSAEIHYLWHISTYDNPANTADHVRQLLNEFDLVGNPDSLQLLVDALCWHQNSNVPLWDDRDFVMLGDKRRADTFEGSVEIVDSDHELTYSMPNRQLDVTSRGNSSVHKTHIEDFRSFPPTVLSADRFRVVGYEPDCVTLSVVPSPAIEPAGKSARESQVATSPFDQYTFDISTHTLIHAISYSQEQVYREVWQQALTKYPGGVVLPSLRLKAIYNDGILKSLTVWLIEEAQLNSPVDESRFLMPVAENTVLVDSRFKERLVHKVRNPVDDVRSILVPVMASHSTDAHKSGSNWRWILIFNGIILIGFSIWLWRRESSPVKSGT
ncbi:MAG: hypothetical protein R3C02_08640 [Planctomycetaceae bacterium]